MRTEVLECRILPAAIDFGDAPPAYRTRAADNGAGHVAESPHLGVIVTTEADGQPSASADSDVGDDGVSFPNGIRTGSTLNPVLIEAAGAGYLDAWVDWNADGIWDGAGEQILSSAAVTSGSNTLYFSVPASAQAGLTFARFRISSEGGLTPFGTAPNGEVEDYQVTVHPPERNAGVFDDQLILGKELNHVFDAVAVDLDKDGSMDTVAAEVDGNRIVWLRGSADHKSYSPVVITDTVDGPLDVAVADINRDGRLDVLVASANDHSVRWFENQGTEVFIPHVVTSSLSGASAVAATDFDQDGDTDILAGSVLSDELMLYRNKGNEVFSTELLSDELKDIAALIPVDFNGDGLTDIVSAAAAPQAVTIWYGHESGKPQPEILYAGIHAATDIEVTDIDGDGDHDLIALHTDGTGGGGSVILLEQTPDKIGRRILVDAGVTRFAVGDLDGDGRPDLITSSEHAVRQLMNDGYWSEYVLAESAEPIVAVGAADFDTDGDLDAFFAEYSDNGALIRAENLPVDFGNADEKYPVLRRDRGAHHAARGPFIGHERDAEPDGNPGGPLESSLVWSQSMIVGSQYSAFGLSSTGGGLIDAWADFNGDGIWGGPGEQIVRSLPAELGTTTVRFAIPLNAVPGFVPFRVRISSAGGLTPYGYARDGEVQDSTLRIVAVGSSVSFQPQNPALFDSLKHLDTADLDGDGDHDLLSFSDGNFVPLVLENSGEAQFTPHFPAAAETLGIRPVIADIRGDLRPEVLYAVPGGISGFTYTSGGHAEFIDHITAPGEVRSLGAADLDSDGDTDILFASVAPGGNVLGWLKNVGTGFEPRPIAVTPTIVRGIAAADLDNDGDIDIATVRDGLTEIFENDGNHAFSSAVIGGAEGNYAVTVADIDRDGLPDLITSAAAESGVRIYRNSGDLSFSHHASFAGSHVAVADLNGDGLPDLTMSQAATLGRGASFYLNQGNAEFSLLSFYGSAFRGPLVANLFDDNPSADIAVLETLSTVDGTAGRISVLTADRLDYGDAAGYASASHLLTGPRLGSLRDYETRFSQDASADADGEDDDGVLFTSTARQGRTLTFDINVSAPGYVSAWMDFNQDGQFDNDSERIVNSAQFFEAGTRSFSVGLRPELSAGYHFLRFRLADYPIEDASGAADNGEVEDYRIFVTAEPPVFDGPSRIVTPDPRPTLTWTATAGAVGYQVWVTNVSTGQAPYLLQSTATAEYTPSEDLPIGRYNVWVRARLEGEESFSEWSEGINLQINTSAVLHDLPFLGDSTTPVVSWQPLPGAVRYEVWADNVTTRETRLIHDTSVVGTEYEFETPLGFGRHRFWVRGIDASGTAAGWSFGEDYSVVPQPVSPVRPTFDSSPRFEWTTFPDVSRYKVYIQSRGQVVYNFETSAPSFTIGSMPSGPIQWWVRGITAGGDKGPWSHRADFNVDGRTQVLAPIGVTDSTTPEIAWSAVTGAGRYILHVETLSGSVVIREDLLTETTYRPIVPLAAGDYRVWVKAVSAAGDVSGLWSVEAGFTITS